MIDKTILGEMGLKGLPDLTAPAWWCSNAILQSKSDYSAGRMKACSHPDINWHGMFTGVSSSAGLGKTGRLEVQLTATEQRTRKEQQQGREKLA